MKLILLSWSAILLASTVPIHAAESRPNIVFIVADDQGPWAFAASGYAQAKTPNIDRIAREGARFPNAFTPTPVCSPARASIMTSRYGTELGITDWINAQVEPGLGLDVKIPTWPKLLQQAGYDTALFGKWHLGDRDEQHPTKRGYGTFMGFRGGATPPKDPVLEKDGVTAKREGFIVDIVADEAIAWLKGRDPARPFAASIHFREPHAAYLPVRDEDWAKLKDLDPSIPNPDLPGLDTQRVKKLTREYLASVAAIDRNVGHLLDTLDALKLTDSTLVIYTSDHGYNLGHHGLLYKGNAQWMTTRGNWPPATRNVPAVQRPNMFDTSVKIPLVMRWPGVIAPSTVNSHTVSHLDWLPTFVELGAATIPGGTVVRGRSIVPLLRGQAKQWDDDYYAEYSMKHGASVHLRMYRTPEWKLIRDFNNEGRDELYHLAVDPEETHNLINSPSPEAKQAITNLDARLLAKMEEIKDPVLPQARKRLATDSDLQRWLGPQNWQRDTEGPILSLGRAGAFDDQHIHAPCVAYENDRFLLWYAGSQGTVVDRVFRLGLATSRDGRDFERHADNPVLQFTDARHSLLTPTLLVNTDGTLIREQGKLRLWFSSTDFHDATHLHTLHEATSADGIHWSEPSPALLEHVYAPTIVLDGGKYLLWYTDVSSDPWCLRHATSDDGRKWDVLPEPVLRVEQAWESNRLFYPTVLKIDGLFVMWYGSYWKQERNKTALGFAVSRDGRNWIRSKHNPVLRPAADRAWESHYTTSQSVIRLGDGTWRIWYATRSAPPFVHKYFAIGTAHWPGPQAR